MTNIIIVKNKNFYFIYLVSLLDKNGMMCSKPAHHPSPNPYNKQIRKSKGKLKEENLTKIGATKGFDVIYSL